MEPANGDASGGADSQKSGQICRDFLRKVCNRGNACRYVHPQDAEKKLEFCHDFQNSICSRSNCKFIHCSKEEENYYLEKGELPTSVDEVGNRGSNRGGAHQEIGLCRDFINGKCSRGARCKFRHQRDDDILDNDPEYGRSRGMRGARGGFGPRDDPYGYDAYPRSAGAMDAYRAISRYGRPGGYGGAGAGHLAMQELEDENSRLRQRVELLRKQVDDLTSTNEVLLQQNATLRTGKADVQLAMM